MNDCSADPIAQILLICVTRNKLFYIMKQQENVQCFPILYTEQTVEMPQIYIKVPHQEWVMVAKSA